MSRKQASHARIVETASRAIRQFGCQGLGVADIMKAAGMTHGGFYAHFESRDALVAEALGHAGCDSLAMLSAAIDKQLGRGATPLEALVASYLSDSHLGATDGGCPIAALAGEVPRQADAIRKASAQRLRAFIDAIRSWLPGLEAPASAEALACALVGALQLARVIGNNKAGKTFLAARRAELIAQYAD